MHKAVAITGQQDVLIAYTSPFHHFFLHILGHTLFNHQLRLTRKRIERIKIQFVLMSVHRKGYHTLGIRSLLYARKITVRSQRYIHAYCLAGFHIITPKAHHRVVLTSLGILIGIFTWIIGILFQGRLLTAEQLQGVSLHLRLIITNPAECSSVSIPSKSLIETKLFFVHPVRDTINDFIELAVVCNLYLLLTICDKKIVPSYKSHMAGVW